MMSYILKFVDLPKTKKCKYLKNEILFFQNETIHLLYIKGL